MQYNDNFKKHYANTTILGPPPPNDTSAIADTGATGHYLKPEAPNIPTTRMGPQITVGLPNGGRMQSTGHCQLDLPQLPEAAREAHILPGLSHSSLLSIGKLCDAGCLAQFDAKNVIIQRQGMTLLTGTCDPTNGLWRLPLVNPPSPPVIPFQCNNAYQTTSTAELMQYLHAAAFSPVQSTWLQAIERGYFQSWPGLTA